MRKSAWRVVAEHGQAVIDVELRHARVLGHELVDPGPLEPTGEHGVLGRADHPVPGEHGRDANTASTAAGTSASRAREEHGGHEQPDHEGREQPLPESGPGPATCASTQTQSAPGTVSMPGLVRELAEREDRRQHEREPDPDRGRDERARQAVREPDDEDDQPERQEVEGVAVVQPVVAPRRAREGGDDEEPDRIRGEEERGERRLALEPARPLRRSRQRTIGATASGMTAR